MSATSKVLAAQVAKAIEPMFSTTGFLFAVGVAVVVSVNLAPDPAALEDIGITGFGVGLISSGITAALIFLWSRYRCGISIKKIFGEKAITSGVTLVYPEFGLSEKTQRALRRARVDVHDLFAKVPLNADPLLLGTGLSSPTPRKRVAFLRRNSVAAVEQQPLPTHVIDAPRCAAVLDLVGLSHVYGMLREVGIDVDISSDRKALERCSKTVVAFGLTSNEYTIEYLHRTCVPLFKVNHNDIGEEILEVAHPSGEPNAYRTTKDQAYGVILRTTLDPHQPERKLVICAGLGPDGTSGAAWYLANNWRKIAKELDGGDFVIVVALRPGLDPLTRQVALVRRSELCW
jgi:hypothetical protein